MQRRDAQAPITDPSLIPVVPEKQQLLFPALVIIADKMKAILNRDLKTALAPIIKALVKKDNHLPEVQEEINARINNLSLQFPEPSRPVAAILQTRKMNRTRAYVAELAKLHKIVNEIIKAEIADDKQAETTVNGVHFIKLHNKAFFVSEEGKRLAHQLNSLISSLIDPSSIVSQAEYDSLLAKELALFKKAREDNTVKENDHEIVERICRGHSNLERNCKTALTINRQKPVQQRKDLKSLLDEVFASNRTLGTTVYLALANAAHKRNELKKLESDKEIKARFKNDYTIHSTDASLEQALEAIINRNDCAILSISHVKNALLGTVNNPKSNIAAAAEPTNEAKHDADDYDSDDDDTAAKEREELRQKRLEEFRLRKRVWLKKPEEEKEVSDDEEEEDDEEKSVSAVVAAPISAASAYRSTNPFAYADEDEADTVVAEAVLPAATPVVLATPSPVIVAAPAPVIEEELKQEVSTPPAQVVENKKVSAAISHLDELTQRVAKEEQRKALEAAALNNSPKMREFQRQKMLENNLHRLQVMLRDAIYTQEALNFWSTQVVGPQKSLVGSDEKGVVYEHIRVLRKDCGDYLPARQTVPTAIFHMMADFRHKTALKPEVSQLTIEKSTVVEDKEESVSGFRIESSVSSIIIPDQIALQKTELMEFLNNAANVNNDVAGEFTEKQEQFTKLLKEVHDTVEFDQLNDEAITDIQAKLNEIVTPLNAKQRDQILDDANKAERLVASIDTLEIVRNALASEHARKFWEEQVRFGGGVKLADGTVVPHHVGKMMAVLNSPDAAKDEQFALFRIIQIAKESEQLSYCCLFSKPLSRTRPAQNFYDVIAQLEMRSFNKHYVFQLNDKLINIHGALAHKNFLADPYMEPKARVLGL